MKQSKFILLILIVFTVGVWGCARQTGGSPGLARLRELETRNAKLEEDYRAVMAQRDQERRGAAALAEKCTQLAAELDQLRAVSQERDDLRKQLATLTTERNAVQATLSQFTKDLQQLLGKMETTTSGMTPTAAPASSATLAHPGPSQGPVIDLPNKS
jgi:chromosome segregation ATPase